MVYALMFVFKILAFNAVQITHPNVPHACLDTMLLFLMLNACYAITLQGASLVLPRIHLFAYPVLQDFI